MCALKNFAGVKLQSVEKVGGIKFVIRKKRVRTTYTLNKKNFIDNTVHEQDTLAVSNRIEELQNSLVKNSIKWSLSNQIQRR